jgi:membrane-bound ClpP family serine protease
VAIRIRPQDPQDERGRRGWSPRILLRYSLLQLPPIALLIIGLMFVRRWIEISGWVFWGSIFCWVAKDIILFPFTWRAYEWNDGAGDRSLIGIGGTARDRLAPSGFIQVRGELWMAEVFNGGRPIEEGERVQVNGIRGLTLLVQPQEVGKPDKKD